MLSGTSSSLRDGAIHPYQCGPMGKSILEKIADPDNGLILDAWIDADGNFGGTAGQIIQQSINTRTAGLKAPKAGTGQKSITKLRAMGVRRK